MKFLVVLLLAATVAAAPNAPPKHNVFALDYESLVQETPESRNFLINALIRQLFAFVRNIIANGSGVFGIPPLDPLKLDHTHLDVQAGLINLNLELREAVISGIGEFVVHKSDLDLSELSFDIDISVPVLNVTSALYDLDGDILTAIPIYGKGRAEFIVGGFRFQAKLYLKQSEDLLSVILDRVDDIDFDIPSFKSKLTGVIGGGDIDAIVNLMLEEVVIDYVLRFRGAIASVAETLVLTVVNPVLEQLDTWKFIAPLLPRV